MYEELEIALFNTANYLASTKWYEVLKREKILKRYRYLLQAFRDLAD